MKRAALHNLGCKVNEYETEAMGQLLKEAGYEIVPFEKVADVYVVNTCSVTNIADRKSRQMLRRAKKRNPEAVIVAAGCYVQTAYKNQQMQELEEICDIILGNNEKEKLVPMLTEHFATGGKEELIEDLFAASTTYENLEVLATGEKTRAFLKIQDGCNRFCSYCIIPYARGRLRSAEKSRVLKQVELLSEKGYHEVVLSGIHIDSYEGAPGEGLLDLLVAIGQLKNPPRIRIGSMEPMIMTEDFVRSLSRLPYICPHFHLSLQSGSDTVLSRMNRKYTTAQYEEAVRRLRKYFKNPAITTDIIVGFPQESEEEFQETLTFAEQIGFAQIHVFPYSKRQGTVAAEMTGQIPMAEKQRRVRVLMEKEHALEKEYIAEFRFDEGKLTGDCPADHFGILEILFERETDIEGVSYWEGLTREYLTVYVPTKDSGDLKNKLCFGCLQETKEDAAGNLYNFVKLL